MPGPQSKRLCYPVLKPTLLTPSPLQLQPQDDKKTFESAGTRGAAVSGARPAGHDPDTHTSR